MTLISQLRSYTPYDATEMTDCDRTLSFLQRVPQPFHRETLEGHITGSAIVINPSYDRILLLHHRQLGRWLQPGGHCDGDPDTLAVALKEVVEETGVRAVQIEGGLFDVDVHAIPMKGTVPSHWHYDIRYLVVADDQQPLQRSHREAIALEWIPLAQLLQVAPEESFRRVQAKLKNPPCYRP